jgi:hypothetical protein
LAELIAAAGQSAAAIGQLRSAASFALATAEAPTAVRRYLAQLDFYVPHRDAERGLPMADETIKLAQAFDDRTALVKATLAKISLQDFINQTAEFESTYESLLNLKGGGRICHQTPSHPPRTSPSR